MLAQQKMDDNASDTDQNQGPEAKAPRVDDTPPDVPVTIVDYIVFPIFVASFLAVLVFYEFVQRIAITISRRAHEQSVIWLNQSLLGVLRWVLWTKVEVRGKVALPLDRPIIVISNHQSLFDIPILHCLFKEHRPRFISKKELAGRIPSVSYNLNHGLNCVIDRSDPRQAIPEIEKLGRTATEHKFACVIFPEGTRARDGKLKKFRVSGVTALLRTCENALIVPVTLDGSWQISTRKRGPIPCFGNIVVLVDQAVEAPGERMSKKFLDGIHDQIANNLVKLRVEGQ